MARDENRRSKRRRTSRRRFERRFSSLAMARGYVDIYADRLAQAPFAPDLLRGLSLEASMSSETPANLARLA